MLGNREVAIFAGVSLGHCAQLQDEELSATKSHPALTEENGAIAIEPLFTAPRLLEDPEQTVKGVAELLGVGRSTLYRALERHAQAEASNLG